jgi:dienelactone hydrolase
VMATDGSQNFFGPIPTIPLPEAGTVPHEMVMIPRGWWSLFGITLPIPGFDGGAFKVDRFFMDRYEVTNREFSEFVESGGYDNPDYWDFEFLIDGRVVDWEEARKAFRDATGRVGPSTWQLGRFPAGMDDHPVGGLSWYEAAAYARFRNKSLPTIYHWWLATHVSTGPLAPDMAAFANFAGRGTQVVGESNSIAPWGTYDNAGNVREWIWNEGSSRNRWIMGGGWDDAPYALTLHYELPPMDRSATNGVRLVRFVEEVSDELLASAEVETRDFRKLPPVSDEGFRLLHDQFDYDPSEVTYHVERLDEADWRPWEKVTVTPRSGEPFAIHLITPDVGSPPRQAVIFFPGGGEFLRRVSCDERVAMLADRTRRRAAATPLGGGRYILESGRAFVMPVWSGACERYDDFNQVSQQTRMKLRAEHILAWHEELGRTLDYLQTRDDIARGAYGYLGMSYGGSRPLPLLALEDRLKAAVIYLGGFPHGTWPQIADPVNYVPRIRLPFLMLAGRFDAFRPFEISQRPLYDLIGTPEEHKKLLVYERGHGPLPRAATMREIADWFDEYLGN